MEVNELFELMTVANYLGIELLFKLTGKAIANLIKGKTPEKIRETFGIKTTGFTNEDLIRINRELRCIENFEP